MKNTKTTHTKVNKKQMKVKNKDATCMELNC